ncbi:hypothetical protein HYU92_06655 [Candidatus Curtissbacteria bacterium]|nr:hypothetical protein [Candidatus Curtissbacteria bacterium]
MRFSPKPGVTIIEIIIGLLLIGLVAVLISIVFSANLRLFLTQITGIGIAEQNKIVINDFTNQTRQAESIVSTCPGGACPDDTTGDSVIVYRIWSLDASGNPTSSTYDYVVLRQDPLNTTNFIRKIYPDPASSRTGGTHIIATNLAANGLDFDYNDPDPTQASYVTITVTTTSTQSGKTQTITNSAKAKLRNKPIAAIVEKLFIKSIGGSSWDSGQGATPTSDNGTLLTGQLDLGSAGDVLVTKYDSAGTVLWAKSIGTPGENMGRAVNEGPAGSYLLVGTSPNNGGDILFAKLNSSGNLDWAKTIGGAGSEYTADAVQQTTDGGYMVAGRTNSWGAGSNDLFLVKLGSSGNFQWAKTVGGPASETVRSAQQTSDGGYVLAGNTLSYGAGEEDFFLVKLDSSGNLQWAKTAGSTGIDRWANGMQTADGGYIMGGETFGFGMPGKTLLLVKFDSSGNVTWAKTVREPSYDYGHQKVTQTPDGGYVAVGERGSTAVMVKLDSSGDHLWTKAYSSAGLVQFSYVKPTSDGKLVASGHRNSPWDNGIVKTDQNGQIPGCSDISGVSPNVTAQTLASPAPFLVAPSPVTLIVPDAAVTVLDQSSLTIETRCEAPG